MSDVEAWDWWERHGEPELKWFAYHHLFLELKPTAKAFASLALSVVECLPPSGNRTMSLRYLVLAKDAAVLAKVRQFEGGST